jgi:hypothetical protein
MFKEQGFVSYQGKEIFLFSVASRQPQGLTQFVIQWVQRAVFMGVKKQGREAEISPPPSAEVKNAEL